MKPDSINEQYNVCGSPNCKCKDKKNPQKHGPYYYLSFTFKGKICGKTAWVWNFSTDKLAYFVINRTRGSTILFSVLGECFKGIIISDFWSAYNKISTLAKQKCLVHSFREVRRISKYSTNTEWIEFAKNWNACLPTLFVYC